MRDAEILLEQQPPQGVFACDHTGLVINKFSDLRPERARNEGSTGPKRLDDTCDLPGQVDGGVEGEGRALV